MVTTQQALRRLLENKALVHLGWCLVVFVPFLIGMMSNAGGMSAVALNGLVAYFFVLTCIYAGRWQHQQWRLRPRLTPFLLLALLLSTILALMGAVGLRWMVHSTPMAWSTGLGMGFPFVVFLEGVGFLPSVIRTTLLEEVYKARAAEQQRESELRLLQDQLSPHFLFNTLHNLYGLSITQHERVPPLLLKLSELLRYSVYRAKQTWVPLAEELAYIRTYIAFEQLRMGNRLHLSIQLENFDPGIIQIAPLLLIVFVENAFKHAKNTSNDTVEIAIRLQLREGYLWFSVQNTCGSPEENRDMSEGWGLGLSNAVKRLALLYPDAYRLEKHRKNDLYSVSLQLKAKYGCSSA